MKQMNFLDWIAVAILIAGGLNWGLIGIFNLDLIAAIFGELTTISRVFYTLVGLAAVYMIVAAPSKMTRG